MAIRMSVREARSRLADVVGRVHYRGEAVIVERYGRPMVAVIPVDLYEKVVAEREARFQWLDDLRRRLPDVPADEVARDVQEAVAAVREAAGDSR